MKSGTAALRLWVCGTALALGACGGGGGGSGPKPPPPPPPPPPSQGLDDAEYKASNSATTANALAAYEDGATGDGVKVAVVDTGINPDLPEFEGRIDPASQDVAADRGIVDHQGHGTMVSAIIAANRDGVYMQGVAYDATILSLNVYDPAGCKPGQDCFLDEALPEAIDLARENGARIINMSFGDEEGMTEEIFAAIGRAVDAGIIIVMAAGNAGIADPNSFALRNITDEGASGLFIIAGAMDENRNMAGFSNRAGTTDGADWFLTALGQGNATVNHLGQHVNVNGTSFAAPTVAGAAALLAGTFPNLTGAQIVEILLSSADDAGSAGTDAVYGRGILNIERAFAPQGATMLAGSKDAVSLSDNGMLAGAMGDAMPATGGAIILDGYSRAYVLDLARTLRRTPRGQPLVQALGGASYRRTGAAAGPVSVAVTIRQDPFDATALVSEPMRLAFEDSSAAKVVAATAISRLSDKTALAFGFSQSSQALQQQLSDYSGSAFLIATDPMVRAGLNANVASSVAFRHDFGPVAMTATGERGKLYDRALPGQSPEHLDYSLTGITAERQIGGLSLSVGASQLREAMTVLGGRFSSLFSSGGSRTTFVDATGHMDIGSGWQAFASYRHGWTRMANASGLADKGRFTTDAYAFDVSKSEALAAGDKLAFRVMQPLRVTSGGLDLTLPASYDYATGETGFEQRRFSLAPSGREIDYEVAYGRGLWGGFFDFNAFVRTDPGHIAAMKPDIGAAIRFTARR